MARPDAEPERSWPQPESDSLEAPDLEGVTYGGTTHDSESFDARACVHEILAEAVSAGASHVHVEPLSGGTRVRVRVDGTLRQARTLPGAAYRAMASYLTILASLDVSERRRPQSGEISTPEATGLLALQPLASGSRVVITLRATDAEPRTLDELGLSGESTGAIRDALDAGAGIVLLAGRRGAGKSTTLYAMLDYVNRPELNVLTAEDPVRRPIEGVGQTHVKPGLGLGYPEVLRSLRGQDPDVVGVWSVDDPVAAGQAAEIARDGRLVLAAVRADDACSALLSLGAAAAREARLVVAQRLVPRAGGTGRVPVCETLRVGSRTRSALAMQPTAEELRTAVLADGLRSFRDDAKAQVDVGRMSPVDLERIFPAA